MFSTEPVGPSRGSPEVVLAVMVRMSTAIWRSPFSVMWRPHFTGGSLGKLDEVSHLLLGSLVVFSQSVALPLEVEDASPMEQPVQDGGYGDGIIEECRPLLEGSVGGKDHRLSFIGGVDDLEEVV